MIHSAHSTLQQNPAIADWVKCVRFCREIDSANNVPCFSLADFVLPSANRLQGSIVTMLRDQDFKEIIIRRMVGQSFINLHSSSSCRNCDKFVQMINGMRR